MRRRATGKGGNGMKNLTIWQSLIAGTMQATAFITALKMMGITPDWWSGLIAYLCFALFIRLESGRGFDD
jgi:hypothetical protein